MASDAFQEFGNVEVAKERLMMSVNGPRITGRVFDDAHADFVVAWKLIRRHR